MNTPDSPIVNTLTRVFGAIYTALGVIMASTILSELPEWVTLVCSVAVVLTGAVQAGLHDYARNRTTATDAVLEVRVGDDVLAGPANDRAVTGNRVRAIGDPPSAGPSQLDPRSRPM